MLKDWVVAVLQKMSTSGLAEEADRLQRHTTETEAQLGSVKEQLEELRASTASTIQSLGRNNFVPVIYWLS